MPFLGGSLPVTAIGSNTYAAAIGLSQVIYAGGSLTAQKEAERLALGAAQAQELRTEQAVENSVRRAYYALRAAQAKARVAREALSLAKEHLARAEKLFKAGVVAKNDVLRGGVAVSEAELALIRAQSAEANALTALRRAVGTELIKAELEAPDIFAQKLFSEDGDTELAKILPRVPSGDRTAQAFEARAELKAYALLSKQAEKLARAAQGRTLPQILGAAGYVAADDSFFPGDGEAVAAIGMYWNLYDGGEMRAKTREAKAKAKELLFQLEDMKNAVRMEVVQAEQNLASARSRLEVAAAPDGAGARGLPHSRAPLRGKRRHGARRIRLARSAGKRALRDGGGALRHKDRRSRSDLRGREIDENAAAPQSRRCC